jgi:hypothetical protein
MIQSFHSFGDNPVAWQWWGWDASTDGLKVPEMSHSLQCCVSLAADAMMMSFVKMVACPEEHVRVK